MTIYRIVESLIVSGDHLILTLSCKHQYRFSKGYFRNKPFPTNASGMRLYRCRECERLAQQPSPGGAA